VKVLQYRSVAFVTYKSEYHAQFAKEAMACQSLDNDEILNVRWATEDPNPVSKVNEKRRLEELGQEVIQSKMDPTIVDAMRSIRALEEGDQLEDDIYVEELEEDDEQSRGAKRRRLEAPELPAEQQQPPPQANGLLSADTIEGLKFFAEIRKKHGAVTGQARVAPPPSTNGLGGLGDYGSDDDD
jgi:hypothetical protein